MDRHHSARALRMPMKSLVFERTVNALRVRVETVQTERFRN